MRVDGLRGDIGVQAMNGGISLKGVAGKVQARTTNGGISVALAGDAWQGAGLDVESTNGGISIALPRGYSAEIDAKTQMGRISAPDLVVTNSTHTSTDSHSTTDGRRTQHSYGDEVQGTLGEGGPRVRVVTRNGGISIVPGRLIVAIAQRPSRRGRARCASRIVTHAPRACTKGHGVRRSGPLTPRLPACWRPTGRLPPLISTRTATRS